MNVSTLDVKYFPEDIMLRHVQRGQLEEIIHAVFQHHAMQLLFLRHINQRPNLLHIHGGRNLYCHVFTVFHRVNSHRRVMQPIRGDIHQVNIIPFAKLLPCVFTSRIPRRLRQSGTSQYPLRLIHPFRNDITESHDFCTRYMRETFHRTGTAHAQSYESYAYYFHLRDSQSQHAFLAGGTLGSFYYDGPVFPLPISAVLIGLPGSLCRACTHHDAKSQQQGLKSLHTSILI